MAKITHRESFVLGRGGGGGGGYGSRRFSFDPTSYSAKETLLTTVDSDINFNDVFGGPPRRFSIQEVGTNFNVGEEVDDQKPVFGEENHVINRRRKYQSGDFYEDIFRGKSNCSSPARRVDLDPCGSSMPGSRVLSPARPLPPKADPFPSSDFSLPAKFTKTMEFPIFASKNCSPSKYKDSISNGTGQPYMKSASLSRFSSQAIQGDQYDLKNDVHSWYCQSPLSHESSPKSEDSSNMTKSDQTETGSTLKAESKNTDILSSSSRFHLSIYKWVGKGVPFLMPSKGRNVTNLKENGILDRCPSSNGRIESDRRGNLPGIIETIFTNNRVSSDTFNMERKPKIETSNKNGAEQFNIFEEAVLHDIPEQKSFTSVECTVDNVPGDTIFSNGREETKNQSWPVENEREVSKFTQEASTPYKLMSLSSLVSCEIEKQGEKGITQMDEWKEKAEKISKVSHPNADYADATKHIKKNDGEIFCSNTTDEGKEKVEKISKVSLPNAGASKPIKENEEEKISSNTTEVDKSTPIISAENPRRSGVNGKVKEFVKIFNQEASPKPKINATQTPSARWKGSGINGVQYNETNVGTNEMDKKSHLPDVNKMLDTSSRVDESAQQLEESLDHKKTTIASNYHFCHKDASSFSEPLPDDSKVTLVNIDDLFLEDFLIKELPNDQDNLQQTGEDYKDVQVWDAKIQHWSNGKKGNIRSLLSTLQHALWPQSGWKQVPLVDIIEGNAVKRAYQKALLRLHPDKLQQKGAPSYQKYVAEKVFDILQEAWEHFNSLSAL